MTSSSRARARRHTASSSPLIDPRTVGALDHREVSPAPHTNAELASVINLLLGLGREVTRVAVGHSRDVASRAAADAFVDAWQDRGDVSALVSWPESAASWLRPAQRLTAHHPDAWVIAAAPLGFAQLCRRLCRTTAWSPVRTVAFASLHDARLPPLAGTEILHGLRGATASGGTWAVRHGWITTHD